MNQLQLHESTNTFYYTLHLQEDRDSLLLLLGEKCEETSTCNCLICSEPYLRSFQYTCKTATRTMKGQDTKRAFKLNFPNFPAKRLKVRLFEPQKIWYQNAPNLTQISKTIGFLGKHPCVTRKKRFQSPWQALFRPERPTLIFSDCPETGLP